MIVAKSDAMGLDLPPGHAVRTTQAPAEAVDAMMRQAGVIRVETIEQLLDVAQIVSSQPLPKGSGLAVFSNSRALGKVVADSAADPGARGGTHRHRRRPGRRHVRWPCRRCGGACRKRSAVDSVHAVVVALLPARGLTVEKIAGVLAECSAAAGKPVVAAFSGILDPSVYVEGMVGAGAGEPAGAAGDPAGAPCPATPTPAPPSPPSAPSSATPSGWTGTRDSSWSPRAATRRAPARSWSSCSAASAASSCVRLDQATAARLLGHYGIRVVPSEGFETAGGGRRRRGPARLAGGA